MNIEHYGLLGLIILVLDIFAVINVVSSSIEPISKIFWILIIIVFPILGVLLWIMLGPRSDVP